jgi:hemerythrin-like domain-containing protein
MTEGHELSADAPFRRSVEILEAEHREIERVMRLFEAAVERLRRSDPVPLDLLSETVEFFQVYADERHHAKEERRLFPLLADHGMGREMSAVHALVTQHDTGRAYVREMRDAIGRIQHGDRLAILALVETAHAYLALLREHIRIEDLYVYPLAAQHLTPAEDAMLCRQFREYSQRHETATDRLRHQRMLARYESLSAA